MGGTTWAACHPLHRSIATAHAQANFDLREGRLPEIESGRNSAGTKRNRGGAWAVTQHGRVLLLIGRVAMLSTWQSRLVGTGFFRPPPGRTNCRPLSTVSPALPYGGGEVRTVTCTHPYYSLFCRENESETKKNHPEALGAEDTWSQRALHLFFFF